MLRRLAARAARRRRRRRASTADVFVSRHTAVPREDVDAYVKTRVLPAGGPSQAARVDGSGANLLLKECPSAGFCSPTKYAGTGKPGNDYKFAILRDGGAYFCHRCGGKGSWYDLRLGMSGAVPSSLEGEVQSTPRVRSGDTPRPDAAIAARCPVALFDAQGSEVKRYLNETRGLNDTTLAVYGVGYASRKFRDGERWVDEPCATFPWIQVPDDGPASTVRLKVRSVRTKRHMRVEPAGGDWGLFGLHAVPADASELVITEGEYDAMAVYQATGRAAVSLPNGAASLPPAVLPLLERFKRIFLWCDGDEAGVNAARKFSAKLGRHRCVIVRAPDDLKDANDCLRKDPALVKRALDEAGAPDHDGLVSFKELRGQVLHELRHPDLYVGAPLPSFPKLTGLVKGARPGELTLLTGPSGAGKTTLASQISIDLLESGAPTLWGSFEVKNSALAIKMLRQQARRRDGLPNEPRLLDALCDDFQRLPLHFMRFHAATEVDDVVDAMEFAAYVHDVEHVVLDNLQFMTQAGPRDASRFEAQDRAIARFRDFATRRGVHVVLVVHPRKEDPTQKLALTSIYGGAKAAQEADNVLILQAPAQPVAPGHASSQSSQAPIPKWVEVAKNRYAGTLGSVMMLSTRWSPFPVFFFAL